MTKISMLIIFVISSFVGFGQSIDEPFSQVKMQEDLAVFKEIRKEANSGLYKYRTEEQIDSLYNWADNEIQNLSTYRDFYNLISTLTDYEGSTHNKTALAKQYRISWQKEDHGYFPYPLKWIEGKWLINHDNDELTLGTEVTAINDMPIHEVIASLYKYYTTDGINITGKRIAIASSFSFFYRHNYGLTDEFEVDYISPNSSDVKTINLKGTSFVDYYRKYKKRHSYPFDKVQYEGPEDNEKYTFEKIDNKTGLLRINTFAIGSNEKSEEHIGYKNWLDSTFLEMQKSSLENLIVDIRNNGGGTDPNDVITYSYLTDREFQESRQAWISFNKVPMLKYYDTPWPRIIRPIGVSNRYYKKRFPSEIDGKYYISKASNEMKVRQPKKNAFGGNVYLLISPRVASAGSLFGAMLAGNKNTITVGEETNGGYYGHNGHEPISYILPNSGLVTTFSIDNIEQDVPEKSNQYYNRGIMPNYDITQSFEDFLNNEDTQIKFVLELIIRD